jgi:hypothetical protein
MSPERVADHIIALDTRRVDFVDEFLTIPRQLAIGQELDRRGYRASWQCYLTVNDKLLDPDVCAKLAEYGCSGVQLGLERHWAYQVTSTVPWWTNRGRYTLAELRAMGDVLAANRQPEPSIPDSHMKRALAKSSSAVCDELGIDTHFGSYEIAQNASRELPGDMAVASVSPRMATNQGTGRDLSRNR